MHQKTPLWLKLNPNKAAGPDKLQPQVHKELTDVLAPMVTLICNAYKWQKMPGDGKTVYSGRERSIRAYKASNYRPVSLTCILCKCMEHIVASQIMQHLTNNNILYCTTISIASDPNSQTQLIKFTEDMLIGMKDGKIRLLHKLHMYGMALETCSCSRSFLCGRTQHVVVDKRQWRGIWGGGNHLWGTTGLSPRDYLLPDLHERHSKIHPPPLGQTVCWQCHHMTEKLPKRHSSFGEVGGWLDDGVPSWQMLCNQNNHEEDNQ